MALHRGLGLAELAALGLELDEAISPLGSKNTRWGKPRSTPISFGGGHDVALAAVGAAGVTPEENRAMLTGQ